MGHARITNISQFSSRFIRRPEGATVKEIVDELEAKKQAVHASEGLYYERYMLSMTSESYVSWLLENKLIEPKDLTEEQKKILAQWTSSSNEIFNWDIKEYDILDSIRWTTKRKVLPLIHNFEN